MFGPLPWLHRIAVVLVTLVCGVLSGAWFAHVTPVSLAVSAGALLGGLVGLVASYLVVRDPHPQPRPVRVTRRR